MSLCANRAPCSTLWSSPWKAMELVKGKTRWRCVMVGMSNRSKNRKPLQKGRNLSIEAIQTVQALKRAQKDEPSLDQEFHSKFKRLLKLDMIAVLRELLRQNQCFLALKVFEDIRKEYWYRPQVSLYAEMIKVLGSNGLFEHVELLHSYLKTEAGGLGLEIEGFNAVLRALVSFNLTKLAMECYYLMKQVGCDPDKSSFKILITALESNGETGESAIIRQDAQMYYGEDLEFLEEEEIMLGVENDNLQTQSILGIDSDGMRDILSCKAMAYLEHVLKLEFGNPDVRIVNYLDVSGLRCRRHFHCDALCHEGLKLSAFQGRGHVEVSH